MTDQLKTISSDFYLLAFDTSGKSLSMAILNKDRLLAEKLLNINNQHSVHFLPALKSLIEEVNLSFEKISAIAVTVGPGSFTGIRIGISTANTMAFDLDIPVFSVSSLKALAEPFLFTNHYLLPAFDARGGRVYAALYKKDKAIIPDRQFVDMELAENLMLRNLQDENILLLGDGSQVAKELLLAAGFSKLQQVQPADRLNYISSASIAKLALKNFQSEPSILEKKYHKPVLPQYCALTQAERNFNKH